MARHRPVTSSNRYITGDIEPIPQPKARASAPLVEAVEPIKGDWSQNNNWAFTFDKFSNGLPLVNSPTIISIGQNLSFRGPPRVRGLRLTRQDQRFLPLQIDTISIQARITYGAGGTSNQLIVDWGAAVNLNIIASQLTVEAIINGTNGVGTPARGTVLQVFFSNELIPEVGYTTVTTSFDNSLGGNEVTIPANAVGFTIASATDAPGEIIRAMTLSGLVPGNVLMQYFDMLDQSSPNYGQICWLPSATTYIAFDPGAIAYVASINWILNV